MKLLTDLYNYRELLKTNVKKEIRGKYKGSILGVLWSFFNPLLSVAVYAIVFPYIMHNENPNYLEFLVVGIIPWTFFTTTLSQGITSISANAGIIKKVYFPREVLPISVALSGFINFFISCIIILAFCIYGGLGVSWHILFVPIIALVQLFLSLGLILGLSAINIYVKDTEYIIPFIINLLFYGTPILFPASIFSEQKLITTLMNINPLTHIINAYRDVFMEHQIPELANMMYVIILSAVIFIIGLTIFRKLEKGFAEEV